MNWEGVTPYTTTLAQFNGRDQATNTKQYQGTETSQTFQETVQTYDGHGRLKTQHRPEQDANTATTYNYNSDDSVQSVTDARGASVQYTYNSRGLVNLINYSVPNNSTIQVNAPISFGYDDIGNRISMTDGLGTVTYEYNQLSQMMAETRQFNDTLPDAPLSNNRYKLEYTYSLGGQLKSYKDPFGVQINYAHDKIGRLGAVTGISSSGTTNYASNAKYRAWGALTHLNYGNGTEMNVGGFNNKLQATNFELKRGTTQLMSKQYDFYGDGLVKKENDLMNAKFDRAYKYDHLARMHEARSAAEARGQTDNAINIPFRNNNQYDAFNNRTQESFSHFTRNGSLNMTYQNNRIVTFLGYNFNNGYDAEGNAIKAPIAANKQYIYDAGGQLSKTNYPNCIGQCELDQEFFDYSGDGLLTKVKTSHQVEEDPAEIETSYRIRSTVLGGEVVTELGGGGNKSRTFVRANGTVIATEGNGTNLWMHKDLNINSLRSTNSSGQIVGSGYDTDDYDLYELDPAGKSVGFFDPYANGIPDPQPGLFVPGQNFSSVINGQITTFTVDGIQVTQGHFTRLVEQAYGSIFGLVEYQARVSARPPRLIGLSVGEEDFPATLQGATRALNRAIDTEERYIIRTFAVNNSWALNLSLLTQALQQSQQEQPAKKPEINNELLLKGINKCISTILNNIGGAASAFQATSGTVNGFATFGERKIENDGSSFDVAQITEFYDLSGGSRPKGSVIVGITSGFYKEGVLYPIKRTLKSGESNTFSPFKNYTANNISAFRQNNGVFSLALINQIHELAHSILRINGIIDGTHTEDVTDVGNEFSDCVEKQYKILSKPKNKPKRKRGG